MMRPGQIEPNGLEQAILEHIAEGHSSVRSMVSNLHVLSREYTGVGSFTSFRREDSGEELERTHVSLNGVIRIPGVPDGLGAVLFCKGTQADCLEIYTLGDDRWDGLYDGFSIDTGTEQAEP